MHEDFRVNHVLGLRLNGLNAREGQFPGQIHACGTQRSIGLRCLGTDRVGLGTDVQICLEPHSSQCSKNAEVCHDQGVHAHVVQCAGRVTNLIVLFGKGIDVERDIALAPVLVQMAQTLGSLIQRQVAGKAAQRAKFGAEVHGVRAIGHSPLEFLQRACRSQEFGTCHETISSAMRATVSAVFCWARGCVTSIRSRLVWVRRSGS